MNKWLGIARLSRDPEIRVTQGGMSIARFGIAIDRLRGKEEEQKADFFNVTAFGKQAEFCEKYLKKGTKIGIEGRLQTDEYTNKDGQKVTAVIIIADRIEFCERKQEQPATDANGFMTVPDNIDSDELPFNF